MSLDFNIISAGPSRAYLKPSDLIPNLPDAPCATITINRAMDVTEKGIQVDVAAFVDGPKTVWIELDYQRFWKPGMILWVATHALEYWEQALSFSQPYRCLPLFQVPYRATTFRRNVFSSLSVLEKCFLFRPKRIRILCADMAGPWVPGKTEAECELLQSCMSDLTKKLGNITIQMEEMRRAGKTIPKAMKVEQANIRRDRDQAQAMGETHFKRWDHERTHLNLAIERAKKEWGCQVEMKLPLKTLVA